MQPSTKQLNLLDPTIPARSIIWFLAWPTIVEQILQVTVTYVDSAMVGSLGAEATAAISINNSMIWLVNGWMNAIAIGFSVLMARNIGAGNTVRAKQVVKQSLLASLWYGAFLTALLSVVGLYLPTWLGAAENVRPLAKDYMKFIAIGYIPNLLMIVIGGILRSSGDSRTPLYLNTFNNLLNILLNLFFIFPVVKVGSLSLKGLGMGVGGASLATTLSCTFTAVLLLLSLFRNDRLIKLEIKDWKFDRQIHAQALKLGIPVALERSTLSFGQIVLTKMVSTLGTAALAAHYLANTAESITYLPPSGISTAATTLVAQSLGKGDTTLAKKFADNCVVAGTILMSTMGFFMFLFAPQLMGIFTSDQTVVHLGAKILRIEAFAEPAFGLSLLVFGVLRGAGDMKGPFTISLAGMWLLRLPLAWVLLRTTHLGLQGIWIAMMSDLILRGIISYFRYRGGSWQKAWK
ncbi:putative efflux protein, MATE family [Sphaerochaeta pleomorpha str. Grapes]|uniref:Multidrug-efflux transporter n=1 Tax=Sphaerochaeta pleomorpha (strain ATCC BAA-1885 / DSM 22778 / Grapes) TaxID=158190 RepID=G8QXS1_SPHPG|nr:MATE family efflux transporter [Sphaerochaeta pleomorpha]AEV30715.1 putative efflux protein, MATE family [Sphaerochaeta pleomorpha str. Grapes]